jgi:hypothetical protein
VLQDIWDNGLALNVCASYLSSISCLTSFAVMFVLLNNGLGLNDELKYPDAVRLMALGLRAPGPALVHHACGASGDSFGRRARVCGSTWDPRQSRSPPTICHLPTSLSSSVRSLSDIERMLESTAGDMYGTMPRNFGSAVIASGSFFSTAVDSETEGIQSSLRGVS